MIRFIQIPQIEILENIQSYMKTSQSDVVYVTVPNTLQKNPRTRKRKKCRYLRLTCKIIGNKWEETGTWVIKDSTITQTLANKLGKEITQKEK